MKCFADQSVLFSVFVLFLFFGYTGGAAVFGDDAGGAYTGDGGKGIIIAVPLPAIQNGNAADNWIPQFFQDSITGDLVRFSAMTVIDRKNEKMVIAEQQLSASGYYSDTDYISMGKMTNAQYLAAGSIQKINGRYSVSFRINNTETNEIRTAFNNQYLITDIENGFAAKEAALELLTGMGIRLTERAIEELRQKNKTPQVSGAVQLAKGIAAETKNDQTVEAIACYLQANEYDKNLQEALTRLDSIFAPPPNSTVKERANYALLQKERWEKIGDDLYDYQQKSILLAVVTDIGAITDNQIDIVNDLVFFGFTGKGVKFVPNRMTLMVTKLICGRFDAIKDLEENKDWAKSARMIKRFAGTGMLNIPSVSVIESPQYRVIIGVYDEYGDRIAQTSTKYDRYYNRNQMIYTDTRPNDFRVNSQQKLFTDANFLAIDGFDLSIDSIPATMTIRIERVEANEKEIHLPVLTLAEWNNWIKDQ